MLYYSPAFLTENSIIPLNAFSINYPFSKRCFLDRVTGIITGAARHKTHMCQNTADIRILFVCLTYSIGKCRCDESIMKVVKK